MPSASCRLATVGEIAEQLRCSQLSLDRDEPAVGSAFAEAGVLLVEQPGPWGPAGLTESRLDATVAGELQARARAAGWRLQAIRRHGRPDPGRPRRWALAAPGATGLLWGSFERDEQLLDLALSDPPPGIADEAPVYLVCAHSRRDRCCAIAGRPLAAALAELAPGRVWETSHLGGHRFAASVLVLPIGALYGRVLPGAAAGLVATSERGEVSAELLRGRIGLSPAEQAADAHVRLRLGIARADGVRVVDSESGADGGPLLVRLDVSGTRYEVQVAERIVERDFVSCGKPAAKAQREVAALSLRRC